MSEIPPSLLIDAIVKNLQAKRLKISVHYNKAATYPCYSAPANSAPITIDAHYTLVFQLRPLHQSKSDFQISIFEHNTILSPPNRWEMATRVHNSDPDFIRKLKVAVQSFFFPEWLENPRQRAEHKKGKTQDRVFYKDLKCL